MVPPTWRWGWRAPRLPKPGPQGASLTGEAAIGSCASNISFCSIDGLELATRKPARRAWKQFSLRYSVLFFLRDVGKECATGNPVGIVGYERRPQPPLQPRRPATTLMIKSRTMAPIVALMIRGTIPTPRWMLNRGNNQSPKKAPITPTMRSPIRPNPPRRRFSLPTNRQQCRPIQ